MLLDSLSMTRPSFALVPLTISETGRVVRIVFNSFQYILKGYLLLQNPSEHLRLRYRIVQEQAIQIFVESLNPFDVGINY
jgi:hypothetical protein